MATWDELQRAVRKSQGKLRASTDADLDDFEATRGVKLPESYRELAKLFGRCEMGPLILAAPILGDRGESMVNLSTFDEDMRGIAREEAYSGYSSKKNAEVGTRLVFFASSTGGQSYGFDPTEVTDVATGEHPRLHQRRLGLHPRGFVLPRVRDGVLPR